MLLWRHPGQHIVFFRCLFGEKLNKLHISYYFLTGKKRLLCYLECKDWKQHHILDNRAGLCCTLNCKKSMSDSKTDHCKSITHHRWLWTCSMRLVHCDWRPPGGASVLQFNSELQVFVLWFESRKKKNIFPHEAEPRFTKWLFMLTRSLIKTPSLHFVCSHSSMNRPRALVVCVETSK